MTVDGLITIRSCHSVKDTIDALEAKLRATGATVFVRIDHAAGAASVQMPLRPTEVLIFGSPSGGTPLMQASQTIGIDLPLKVLCWEDESADVWLSYNDLRWLAQRHLLDPTTAHTVDALAKNLAHLTAAAAAP